MADRVQVPTFSFEAGVLGIRTVQFEMRIRWRPEPLAEIEVAGRSWRRCNPDFRLLRPDAEETAPGQRHDIIDITGADHEPDALERKRIAFQAFRSELPAEFVSIVQPFSSHQWALLALLHRHDPAVDIARSNPVLAYALANSDEMRGTRPEAAALQALAHSYEKQRRIVGWLGFPGTEAMARLFRKLVPGAVSPSILRRLRNAIDADLHATELLSHCREITAGILGLVINPRTRHLTTPSLLQEVAGRAEERLVSQTADILLNSVDLCRQVVPTRELLPFTSIAQIRTFHDEMDAEYRIRQARQAQTPRAPVRRQPARAARPEPVKPAAPAPAEVSRPRQPRPFPPPPIPGTPEIVPLTSAAEIRQEGAQQGNCVGSYVARVRKGGTYIYKVVAPERATLSILKGPDGCWRRGELERARNGRARRSTAVSVDLWLMRYRLSV